MELWGTSTLHTKNTHRDIHLHTYLPVTFLNTVTCMHTLPALPKILGVADHKKTLAGSNF